ncbi:hypothetical protein DFH07DRAFT_765317 [Mycena maculata]|uniref:Uncharacterized protein n=1 Tax=Mycena maculata TaxID=230809 RepID=A0AAD7KDE2_9AGAR|nr:hypothetical protein DFH07DRAFT_765317 [Mycena maculata]
MTDTSLRASENNSSSSHAELDELLKRLSELTRMSLDMTRLCLDVQETVPGIALARQASEMMRGCMDLRVAIPELFARLTGAGPEYADPELAAVDWVEAVARTPDEMDAYYPPGIGDDISWHVVCIGREPGLYASVNEADRQIRGVPNQFRQKKTSRVEALTFYRLRHSKQQVRKMVPIPVDATAAEVEAALAPTDPPNAAALVALASD